MSSFIAPVKKYQDLTESFQTKLLNITLENIKVQAVDTCRTFVQKLPDNDIEWRITSITGRTTAFYPKLEKSHLSPI